MALAIVLPFIVLFPSFATSQSSKIVQIGKNILSKPHSICVLNGQLFITDTQLNEVLCFSTSGELVARKNVFGAIKLSSPMGICSLPTGEIVVADSGNKRILLLDQFMGELRSFNVEDKYFENRWMLLVGGAILVLDNQKEELQRPDCGQIVGSFGAPELKKDSLSIRQSQHMVIGVCVRCRC